jgi:hypothetical protein
MRADRAVGIILILLTGLLWALYALDADSPVRVGAAIAYLLFAPGSAVMSLVNLAQRWAAALLGVALSLGIVTVVATTLLVANVWTPGRALAIVGCITLLAAGTRLVITCGSPDSDAPVLAGVERREDGS